MGRYRYPIPGEAIKESGMTIMKESRKPKKPDKNIKDSKSKKHKKWRPKGPNLPLIVLIMILIIAAIVIGAYFLWKSSLNQNDYDDFPTEDDSDDEYFQRKSSKQTQYANIGDSATDKCEPKRDCYCDNRDPRIKESIEGYYCLKSTDDETPQWWEIDSGLCPSGSLDEIDGSCKCGEYVCSSGNKCEDYICVGEASTEEGSVGDIQEYNQEGDECSKNSDCDDNNACTVDICGTSEDFNASGDFNQCFNEVIVGCDDD